MLILKDITKKYNDKTPLNRVSLSLPRNEVVGLVGNNGEGKSTLFKIIAGEVEPENGEVTVDNNEKLSYLPQYLDFENLTVGDFLLSKLGSNSQDYSLDISLNQVGLKSIDKNQRCKDLSGGQKTRLYLASAFLVNPDSSILLLDEPTNNMDIEGLEWLEGFIKSYHGLVLLTSHDRYFLDKVTTKIIELKNGKIKVYGGNYSFYKKQRQDAEKVVERMYIVQQKKVDRVKTDIRNYKEKALWGENKFTSRNPYQKKKAAKAARTTVVRERKLEKLLNSEEYIERADARKSYGVSINGPAPSGKKVLEVSNICKSFNGKSVFQNVSFSIYGNERVWLRGLNGSGKTTILKIIQGIVPADSGEASLGVNINSGYFSQDSTLNLSNTGINELLSTGASVTECFNKASHLHLSDSDLRKNISQLSRGQVAKLEFVKLLLVNNDLLILDEPTNHLEIETREEIESALCEYSGALLVASHDRYFIENIGIRTVVEL